MSEQTGKPSIPPKQRIALLNLYNCALEAFGRHFSEYEATGLALYWGSWHAGEDLHLTTPCIRMAVALDLHPIDLMKHMDIYHRIQKEEPAKFAHAYAEFRGLYRKRRVRRPFYVLGEDGYPAVDKNGRLKRNRAW